MKGKLIKGLGICTKLPNKVGKFYYKYEYPKGTEVLVEQVHSVHLVKIGNKTIATFGPSDPQSVYKYVKLEG